MFGRLRLWLAGIPPLDGDAFIAMRHARNAAVAASHRHVGAAHILLGLIDSDSPSIRALFQRLELNPHALRCEVVALMPAAVTEAFDHERHANGSQVLSAAVSIAKARRQRRTTAGHLLWALTGLGSDPASVVLTKHAITPESVEAILTAFGQ